MTPEEIKYINDHLNDDVATLALRGGASPFVLMQIEARQRLCDKLPTILKNNNFIFPTRISTEQASSEITAQIKAGLINDATGTSADLTGGLGIDTIFMARHSRRHHYIELNPDHCDAARNNLPLFLDNVEIHNTDAESFIRSTTDHFSFVYIDPARRGNCNSKVFRLEDCSPNILELKPLIMSKCEQLIVKLSPMLDTTEAIEKLKAERIVIISIENECKELVAVCSNNTTDSCTIEAIEVNKHGRWEFSNRLVRLDNLVRLDRLDNLGYLYEPYAAMMKSGLYREMEAAYGVRMVAQSSHLFLSEKRIDFPGRVFKITQIEPFNKKSVKSIRKANITVRNFPISVSEVRKRFGIADGGDVYLFLTTDNQGNKLIITCRKDTEK